jgi:hypothetical protein
MGPRQQVGASYVGYGLFNPYHWMENSEMKMECPYCHETIVISIAGRKPLGLPVTNVCDALRLHQTILAAANELGCSRGYIYKILKTHGLRPAEVMDGSTPKGIGFCNSLTEKYPKRK